MAGIEVRDRIGEPFDWREQTGARICAAASQHGLLTRPIRDVLVLMLPFCASTADIDIAIEALHRGIEEVCGG
jgi:adenosylmethionine-8-amino-7-oxononanoate aminotransferase